LPLADFGEKLLFPDFRIRFMDKGYFFGWYAFGNQLFPQVIINIEFTVAVRCRLLLQARQLLQITLKNNPFLSSDDNLLI